MIVVKRTALLSASGQGYIAASKCLLLITCKARLVYNLITCH